MLDSLVNIYENIFGRKIPLIDGSKLHLYFYNDKLSVDLIDVNNDRLPILFDTNSQRELDDKIDYIIFTEKNISSILERTLDIYEKKIGEFIIDELFFEIPLQKLAYNLPMFAWTVEQEFWEATNSYYGWKTARDFIFKMKNDLIDTDNIEFIHYFEEMHSVSKKVVNQAEQYLLNLNSSDLGNYLGYSKSSTVHLLQKYTSVRFLKKHLKIDPAHLE